MVIRLILLTSIHSVRKFDKDRMLLHDTLDMLSANANDTLVILIGDMERDGCRHLLFNQGQALLHGFVGGSHDVDIEVVFVEAVKNDLNIACLSVSFMLTKIYKDRGLAYSVP